MSLTSAVANAAAAAAAAGQGKKAAQVQLQAELNTDDEWNKFMLRDGLLVVDVYTEWCGPCIGMVGNLKKIKVEIGGDNLHLAVAKADTIECLKRFRKRSEPTWMFIASGQLVNVIFGADAPRIARTIEQELHNEELAKKGELERPKRAPHELTPPEQVIADREAKLQEEKKAKEAAAAQAARESRREARARRLESHFADVCPALVMPHAQKNLRKISDALEPHENQDILWLKSNRDPWDEVVNKWKSSYLTRKNAEYGNIHDFYTQWPILNDPRSESLVRVLIADKLPTVLGKEGARRLAVEDPQMEGEAVLAALAERPALALLLRKQPDREGDVIEITRRILCGDGVELPEGETPKKTVAEELVQDGVPGVFVPADRHQRAAALDLLFPKMVSTLVEPPPPPSPPHVALVFGAWQRRAVLAAATSPRAAPLVLCYGFFADANLDEPRLLCKTIDQYELRPDKDYCETIIVMAAIGLAEPEMAEGPVPEGPPAELMTLGPLHVSQDSVVGKEECARLFPQGYTEPEHKPKPKTKKKKKKRHEAKEQVEGVSTEAAPTESVEAEAGAEEEPGEGEEGGEGDAEGEEADEGEEEEPGNVDKATSPPPLTPH